VEKLLNRHTRRHAHTQSLSIRKEPHYGESYTISMVIQVEIHPTLMDIANTRCDLAAVATKLSISSRYRSLSYSQLPSPVFQLLVFTDDPCSWIQCNCKTTSSSLSLSTSSMWWPTRSRPSAIRKWS